MWVPFARGFCLAIGLTTSNQVAPAAGPGWGGGVCVGGPFARRDGGAAGSAGAGGQLFDLGVLSRGTPEPGSDFGT
ncbi:hypothetical protein DFJ74DRAFT_655944 [Hyaloraphidium curvatum]|nr:hypothetical protein DFJ74DRAFT_655944 [Hyaloraphidium curvatum]